MEKINPFLTLNGNADQAMQFYASSLPDSKIIKTVRFADGHPFSGPDEKDKILFGLMSIMGREIMFMDMDKAHPAPEFSWSASLYINCETEAEFDAIFAVLSNGGTVMMGPEPVAHLRKCAWVTDKFGVTWQPVWA